jgi:DNA-3-methyladenine glycosylase II
MNHTGFNLPVVSPFRLDLTVWVLRRREKNILDHWDGKSYNRVLILQDLPVKVTVSQKGSSADSFLRVGLQCHQAITPAIKAEAKAAVQKLLGTTVNLEPFYILAHQEPLIAPVARQFLGVKPPRYPSIFEALINAVACQQVSLDAGIAALNRLCEAFGAKFVDGGNLTHAFPRPEDLIDVSEEELKRSGFSYQKARAIRALAYAVISGELNQAALERISDNEAIANLQKIRGIGRWSAEYALLRGLGRLNIFPGDDVGGQNNLMGLLNLSTKPDYESVNKLTASWRPYGGFIYFHLLLHKLAAKGVL